MDSQIRTRTPGRRIVTCSAAEVRSFIFNMLRHTVLWVSVAFVITIGVAGVTHELASRALLSWHSPTHKAARLGHTRRLNKRTGELGWYGSLATTSLQLRGGRSDTKGEKDHKKRSKKHPKGSVDAAHGQKTKRHKSGLSKKKHRKNGDSETVKEVANQTEGVDLLSVQNVTDGTQIAKQAEVVSNAEHEKGAQKVEKRKNEAAGTIVAAEGNVARRMMAQMGWEEGEGLGRNKSGITNPISVEKRKGNAGIGHRQSSGPDGWRGTWSDDHRKLIGDAAEAFQPSGGGGRGGGRREGNGGWEGGEREKREGEETGVMHGGRDKRFGRKRESGRESDGRSTAAAGRAKLDAVQGKDFKKAKLKLKNRATFGSIDMNYRTPNRITFDDQYIGNPMANDEA